jgi:hypothetical protein
MNTYEPIVIIEMMELQTYLPAANFAGTLHLFVWACVCVRERGGDSTWVASKIIIFMAESFFFYFFFLLLN